MEGELEALRELQTERRKIDGQLEGHFKRAELANEAVGFDWISRAACRGSELDPECWFPKDANDRATAAKARAVCWNDCPVRLECLEVACLRRDHGIWGGINREDRRRLDFDYEVLKTMSRR